MSGRLAILLVCRSFPAHRAGGMEWHAQDIVDGLAAAGHHVHILTTRLPAQPALCPLRTNGTIHQIGGDASGRYNSEFFRKLPAITREICRTNTIDLIHAQGFAGIPLVMSTVPVPVITTIHGTLFSETPLDRRIRATRPATRRLADLWQFKHRLAFHPIWRRFLARNPRLITDSEFTRAELRQQQPGINPTVIAPGINLDRYPINLAEPKNHGELILFAAGRLEPIKGFAFLLDALAAAAPNLSRPWRLIIAGDGPERARLDRMASQQPLRGHVEFTGRIPHEQLIRHFAAADLFINPDQGQPAFGLTNAEALVMGTPVLASDAGAHPEIIADPSDGWLAPAGQQHEWSAILQQILPSWTNDPATMQRRIQRSRDRFSHTRMIHELEITYSTPAPNPQTP